jgi:hypothetical protein
VTGLEKDSGLVDQPPIWGCYEPSPEMFDRQLHANFETGRFITTADVKRDDVVNGMKVSRVDMQLGVASSPSARRSSPLDHRSAFQCDATRRSGSLASGRS